MTGFPDFRNMTSVQAVDWLAEHKDPSLYPLIRWIVKAEALDRAVYNARVAIADGERAIEARLAKL